MTANESESAITTVNSVVTSLGRVQDESDLLAWLALQSIAGLETLLATTYDGVLWGMQGNGSWILSNGRSTLPSAEVIDMRAFGAAHEVYVWRDAQGLHGRHRDDSEGDETFIMPEEQLLWGTRVHPSRTAPEGFTMLEDGEQGLAHAVPLKLDSSHFNDYGHRPARLKVRHYIGRDPETGVARIVDSRLIGVRDAKAPQLSKNGAEHDTEA
jgi:CRISPR-associated protein (TIGR03984 family)